MILAALSHIEPDHIILAALLIAMVAPFVWLVA